MRLRTRPGAAGAVASEPTGGGDTAVAEVRDLRVDLDDGTGVVDDVSMMIRPGRVTGLVGESGSGKTSVSLALLAYARRGARISNGRVVIVGNEILTARPKIQRSLRGARVAYVPQDPSAALNPSLRVSTQLVETIHAHRPETSAQDVRARIEKVIEDVGLAEHDVLARYPHQLSGGQQQRVAIAMALLLKPEVLVLDEPTTGLDVTTQARVLNIIRSMCDRYQIGALYVSHDLCVVRDIADDVIVMYAGRVVEEGPIEAVFAAPRHPYTQALLRAIPDVRHRTDIVGIPGRAPHPAQRPDGCFFHPRCPHAIEECATTEIPLERLAEGRSVRCIRSGALRPVVRSVVEPAPRRFADETVLEVRGLSASYGSRPVLFDVSLSVHAGECLAVVGESGSGKTTLSRSIVGLHAEYTGEVILNGDRLPRRARQRPSAACQSLQYIFQSARNALNPCKTIGDILATSHQLFFPDRKDAAPQEIGDAMEHVGLSPRVLRQFPEQLSGGERQRVAIARALICKPAMLVCDEITSALDVSVQAGIIALLRTLQEEERLGLVFVTHNLAVVRNIADSVLVLNKGAVVEMRDAAGVLDTPSDAYTRQLLEDTPTISSSTDDAGE